MINFLPKIFLVFFVLPLRQQGTLLLLCHRHC
ncbi:hypothetical protein G6655_04075 [Polynucleobacter paneuropaeus]|nr:hypothetical protein [Polynucleobacter paneuropaeus]